MKQNLSGQKGQAVVEYILFLSVALAILVALSLGFGKIRSFLWKQILCDVAAPCPDCKIDEDLNTKLRGLPGHCRQQ